MMNPNHPHYAGLGSGPNINLLDTMLVTAGFQATDQPIVPRPTIVPQYTYAQDVSMHQHALNLGQPHTSIAGSDPVHVIVYQQDQQQQQPISYKIPQLGTVVAQDQSFVVNDPGGQISRQQTVTSEPTVSRVSEANIQTTQATVRHIQSPVEKRKDIVAQAMHSEKIFEESIPKMEPVVKQEPGVSGTDATMTSATDTKPLVTATKSAPTTTATTQRRPYQRSSTYSRQQVMPRLTILDDEDDGLTCRLCLASYWYKAEIHEHLRKVHSISDPEKYDKEEKEKKMRRMREEQQRILMAKKQREERERRLREAKYGRGRGGPGTIKLTSPGARPSQSPGQRPSFQYRDGAFICDLCKESFSDGNDMVTHWKSHVKKQQADAAKAARGRPRGRPPGGRGRGRPSFDDRRRQDSSDDDDDDDDDDGGRKKGGKGMPRWTAYLLWSTRKRRDVVVDHPDWTFAQIAKWISDEWKKIDADEKDELQKEAEEMNELGIRKLPRDDDGPDPEKDTTDEDSDFEEGYRKKTKPIMLKIKKEKGDGEDGASSDESDWEPEAEIMPPEREQTRSGRQRKRPSFFQEFESQENNLDSILEQFEKEQAQEFGKPRQPKPEKPPGEKKPRKPRKRKEPAVDQQALEEQVEVEVLRSGRKRKVRRVMTHFMEGSDEDDKLGRGASSDDDDFEPPPEEEVQKIEENDDQIEEDDEEMASEDLEDEESDDDDDRVRYQSYDMELPPKKRGRPKKLLTDEEIEEATKAAIGTKPVIEIVPVPRKPKENGENKAEAPAGGEPGVDKLPVSTVGGDDGTAIVQNVAIDTQPVLAGSENGNNEELPDPNLAAQESVKNIDQEREGLKVNPPWVKETLSDSEGEQESNNALKESLGVETDTPADSETMVGAGGMVDAGISQVVQESHSNVESAAAIEPAVQLDPVISVPAYVNVSEADTPVSSDQFQVNPLGDTVVVTAAGEGGLGDEAVNVSEQPVGNSDEGLEAPLGAGGLVADNSVPRDESSVPLTSSETEALPSAAEQLELGGSQPAQEPPLSEEDLLTGPAHNLDDSQFKPDIVDPNLDDILFK